MLIHYLYLKRIVQETQTLRATYHWDLTTAGKRENTDKTTWPLDGDSTPFLSSRNLISSLPWHSQISSAKFKTQLPHFNKEKDKFRKRILIKNASCSSLHIMLWCTSLNCNKLVSSALLLGNVSSNTI